jgi:choline monooxygenase
MAKVLVIRSTSDGVLRGFRNVCRHRGARLLPEGSGTCSVIQCPYHHWVYGDTGELRRTPWFEPEPDFDVADWPLDAISVAEWRGLVFAAIDPVESLTDQLGDLVVDLADEPIESPTASGSRSMPTGRSTPTTSSRATTSPASIRRSSGRSSSTSSRRRPAVATSI